MQRTRTYAFSARPSLFVAAPGTRSSTHVDQWTGNFWMAMVHGVKRWTLFHADDVPLLSPDYGRGTLDPAFPRLHEMERERRAHFEGGLSEEGSDEANRSSEAEDVFDASDAKKLGVGAAGEGRPLAPLVGVDRPGPGEVLFVPAVSMSSRPRRHGEFRGNYVDESNLDCASRLGPVGGQVRGGDSATPRRSTRCGSTRRTRCRGGAVAEEEGRRYEDRRGGGGRWGRERRVRAKRMIADPATRTARAFTLPATVCLPRAGALST